MAWGTGKFEVECLVLCANSQNSQECVVPQTPVRPSGKRQKMFGKQRRPQKLSRAETFYANIMFMFFLC